MECYSGTSACAVEYSLSSRRDPGGVPPGGRRRRDYPYSKPSFPSAAATGHDLPVSRNGTLAPFTTTIVSPSSMPSRVSRVSRTFVVASVSVALVFSGAGHHGALAQDTSDTPSDDEAGSGSPAGWVTVMQYVMIVVLVMASGLFSGLTLGLLGLDKIGLEIISNGDEPRMAAFAKVITRIGSCACACSVCPIILYHHDLPKFWFAHHDYVLCTTSVSVPAQFHSIQT